MYHGATSRNNVNRLIVFRENRADSHGGISIGAGTDVLLEDNDVASAAFSNADPTGPLDAASTRVDGILVHNTTHGVVMRNNGPNRRQRVLPVRTELQIWFRFASRTRPNRFNYSRAAPAGILTQSAQSSQISFGRTACSAGSASGVFAKP